MSLQNSYQFDRFIASLGISEIEFYEALGVSDYEVKSRTEILKNKKVNAVAELLSSVEQLFDCPNDLWR